MAQSRTKRLPPLPKSVHSHLGDIPVSLVDDLEEKKEALGMWEMAPRRISIHSKAAPEVQLQALYHEIVHVALMDSGVSNGLVKDAEEAVCDAVGTLLASMSLAGRLKLT